MQKGKISRLTALFFGLFLVLLAGCGDIDIFSGDEPGKEDHAAAGEDAHEEMVSQPGEPARPVLVGSSLRGGLLYDKWWVVLGVDAPDEDHPLWGTQDTNTRSGADTWRCKECHGWDYKGVDGAYGDGSHKTGFTGLIQFAGGDPYDVLAALQGENSPDHDFSTWLDEQALTDLALFISEEIMDYDRLVAGDAAAINTDLQTGELLFLETCADCHGLGGQVSQLVSGIAVDNPWEFLHKLRFGQPGVKRMPAVIDIDWSLHEQGALLAYVQSAPAGSGSSEVSGIPTYPGGLLYDNWWKAAGLDEPVGDHPLWSTQTSNTRTGADTWRCKECHGWDYLGVEGAYGDGSHRTGFPGVYAVAGLSVEELTAWLDGSANPAHDFSAYFDEEMTASMVAFLQSGMVDMTAIINSDKSVNGDAAAGGVLYAQACALCHGEAGTTISFGDDNGPVYLGDLARDNPWETLHKAANGQPGINMPAGLNLGLNWEDIVDLLAYLQTLGE